MRTLYRERASGGATTTTQHAVGTRPTVIFIGGMTRSGSTLLDRLLGELPGVCCIGELVNTWQRGVAEDNRCGCGEPFGHCPFWRDVLAVGGLDKTTAQRVGQLRATVDRTRSIPRLLAPSLGDSFEGALDEYLTYCTRLYDAVQAVSGCEAIADSSKNASFAFCLRASRRLDLRVVHVVRDSRAVAHSWTRKKARDEPAGKRLLPRLGPARAACRWCYQNAAFQLLAAMGTPTLRVRYEDLVSAPRETLAEVAQFAGLEIRPEQLSFIHAAQSGYWADLSTSHTGSGNPMRFQTGRTRIRMDDEWRTAMAPNHRRTVTAITAPLLRRYGYLGHEALA